MKPLSTLAILLLLAAGVSAQPKDAFKSATAVFEPAEAKPGQTVSLKITVALGAGYHTYPAAQASAAHKFSVNKFAVAADGGLIGVGDIVDPVGAKSKKDDDGEMFYYPGGGTWLKKVVVSPAAKAGAATGTVKIKLLICDENNCYPPKTIDVAAPLTILDGPAVEVEKAYAKEVEKALKK